MKTTLLALALALTGLELLAQPAPGLPAPGAGRLPRFLGTNNIQGTLPRYQPPGTTPGTPGATPFSPGTAAGAPGTPGAASPATSGNTTVDPQANELQPMINWPSVDLNQALEIYAKYVGRTLLRANLPDVKITLKTETQLTKAEVIQALQAVLALNGIAVVNIGEKFVKVLPVDQANAAGAALDDTSAANLPNLGSYITHITQLKYVKPSIMAPLIQPFAKLQGGLFPIDDNGILVMRDYAENIKRMLEMIDKIDVSVPAEYISEVIPIRYAKVDDIASALNSLGGGGGGATVSIGSSQNSGQISGLAGSRMGSMGGMGGSMGGVGSGIGGAGYQSGGIGGGIGGGAGQYANRTGLGGGATPNPNGTPTGGSSFAQRLNSIINRASGPSGGSGQDQIQLFGQTKIIPNESSSTLLIYATRQDMAVITNIIAKLDVPLAQVLVEAIIMDVKLGSKFTLGVSAAQNPKSFTGANGTQVIGGGGFNNGPSFANFLTSIATNGTTSIGTNLYSSFANGLSSGNGLNYFGNIGQTWDVAVQALESDNNASIIQRPRIQTSQAKAAQFFVGETVPYVTSTYNGYSGGYGGSSYSQLSVGVELDVTPFINPEGLVVMDIQQEYDEISGSTSISGVGDIPNTIKRTLNTEIAVRDRDTIMLGGFIKSDKGHTQSGVPFLQDIPLLGNLFKQRSDTKDREELIVLMRPTVLKTPELAAQHTIKEEQRLPGISAAAAEDTEYERKLVEAERKREKSKFNKTKQYDGFFNPIPDDADTNHAPGSITAPASGQPLTEQEAQAKARAALTQKMSELDATNAPAPIK